MASGTFMRQFRALNKKNFIIFKRDKRAAICEFLFPLMMAGLLTILGTQLDQRQTKPGRDDFYQTGYMIEPMVLDSGHSEEFEYEPLTVSQDGIGTWKQLALIQSKNTFTDFETYLEEGRSINITKEFNNFNAPRDEIRRDEHETRFAGALEVKLEAQNKIHMNLMSDWFESEGFEAFSLNKSETFNFYYPNIEFSRSLAGNYAQLALETHLNKTKPQGRNVKISNTYTYRSTTTQDISNLAQIMDNMFPLLIIVTFSLPMLYIIQRAVEEKASKTRESMRMMGMKEAPYWLSWFVVYFCLSLIISCIMTIGTVFTILKGSNFILIFLVYFLYAASIFGIAILVIAIFDSVKTATTAGMCINLFVYYIRYAVPGGTPFIGRIIVSIFPSLNLYNLQAALWQLQFVGGVSIGNSTQIHGNYSLMTFYIMSIFNIFFWTFFALYISAIIPTEFGTRKHPCFCFRFRRRNRQRVGENEEGYSLMIQDNSEIGIDIENDEYSDAFEDVGNDLKELEASKE